MGFILQNAVLLYSNIKFVIMQYTDSVYCTVSARKIFFDTLKGFKMLFEEEFLESIENDPVDSVLKVIDKVFSRLDENPVEWTEGEYEELLESLSLVLSISDNFDLSISDNFTKPKLDGDIQSDSKNINDFLVLVQRRYKQKSANIRISMMKLKFDNVLGKKFVYEFSQGDLNRIQELVDELRENIGASDLFEKDHKSRLLGRLERLQSELHKRMSDIDRFWGLVGDAGVVLGKLGKDSKPFVDRIKEIADIVWRTQSRAEELPSDTPTPLLNDIEAEK